jgi:hypothetical protein
MGITRETLLKPLPVDIEEVSIPEMGGSVWIKGMTVRERNMFERQFQSQKGERLQKRMSEIRQRMLVACVCNKKGEPLLTKHDIEEIGKQRADIVERLVTVAQRVCGWSDADVDDMAKNSEETSENS